MLTTVVINGQIVTREAMTVFKRQYLEALRYGRETFTHDGQQVLVSYARYVVEYAEGQLGTLK